MKEEEYGLDILEEFFIKCSDCYKKLAQVVVLETNEARVNREINPIKTKFKVINCPFCGGESFPTKIFEGSVTVGTLEDEFTLSTDGDTDIEDGVIVTTLIVKRNKNVS